MSVLKAYKYRIYPTKTQSDQLDQVFGDVRFVWNKLLENFNSFDPCGPNRPLNEKILKEYPEYSFLKESISYALQQKRIDFENTKTQFFNKNRKKKLGRMQFKKKGVSKESFRLPGQCLGYSRGLDFSTSRVRCPKIGCIKVSVDREFTGRAISYTFSKNRCNQYFVSVLVEEDVELKRNTGRYIGIDLGLKDLCILSNGVKINGPKWFRDSQSELKKAQQHLSRKTPGSNRYEKQRLKVAKVHKKVADQRSWYLHNLSTAIVNHYDLIVMEDLNVDGMKRLYGKSASDRSFAALTSMIQYKSTWYGKTVHQISRWYPSSKTCNHCGYKNTELTLGDREWTCPSCGSNLDRDINAANNILYEGLRDLYSLTSDEIADYRRREDVRHASIDADFDETFRFMKSL